MTQDECQIVQIGLQCILIRVAHFLHKMRTSVLISIQILAIGMMAEPIPSLGKVIKDIAGDRETHKLAGDLVKKHGPAVVTAVTEMAKKKNRNDSPVDVAEHDDISAPFTSSSGLPVSDDAFRANDSESHRYDHESNKQHDDSDRYAEPSLPTRGYSSRDINRSVSPRTSSYRASVDRDTEPRGPRVNPRGSSQRPLARHMQY
jgi:hypothetical protein